MDGRTERKLGVSNAAKAWESVPCRMWPESEGLICMIPGPKKELVLTDSRANCREGSWGRS